MTASRCLSIPLAHVGMGKMQAVVIDGRDIVVCHTKDGVFALDNVCTHAYARLTEGRLRGTRLICPLHGAAFDVRTGKVLGAPAVKPLAIHAASVLDDSIQVTVSPLGHQPSAD